MARWLALAAAALTLSVTIRTFVVQVFYLPPSGSMRPTIEDGDRVLVSRLSYRLREPRRGDVVVLDPATGVDDRGLPRRLAEVVLQGVGLHHAASHYIKRVVALPGETVELRDGTVRVDGLALDEPYLAEQQLGSFGPVAVPEGHVWVMGDNRNGSSDSRAFGPVRVERLVGPAVGIIWPPSHVSPL